MADHLSRHPSGMNSSVIKAEMLWIEWFTVNSVNSLNNTLEDRAQPRDSDKTAYIEREKTSINHVEEVKSKRLIRSQETHKTRESNKLSRSVNNCKTRISQSPSIRLINEKLLPAN